MRKTEVGTFTPSTEDLPFEKPTGDFDRIHFGDVGIRTIAFAVIESKPIHHDHLWLANVLVGLAPAGVPCQTYFQGMPLDFLYLTFEFAKSRQNKIKIK